MSLLTTVGPLLDRMLAPLGIAVRRQDYLKVPRMTSERLARLLYFHRMLQLVSDLDGDVIECGVGKGHGLLSWAILLRELQEHRHLWGFDSFEGFPEPSVHDQSPRNPQKGDWSGTSIEDVLTLLAEARIDQEFVRSRLTLVKGFFRESLRDYTGDSIALLHIDVDLYDSYWSVLEQLFRHVAPGGVILFDEYKDDTDAFPGARIAIDEFLGSEAEHIRRDPHYGKYYYVKEGLDAPRV